MLEGNGSNDGIGSTDGLTGALQVCIDAPGDFSALHIQGQHVYCGQPAQKLLDAILTLDLVQALDDF
jgi:hypothetical protein